MALRNIQLRGPEFEPKHPSWRKASKSERERVWRKIGEFAQGAYRAQLLRGEGVDGARLAPVKSTSRPDHATGPPLDPHRSHSRTYDLVSIHSTDHGCTLYWKASGGESWTKILGYHADGLVRGAPVRDVIGLSPRAARQVKERTATYWRSLERKGVAVKTEEEAKRRAEEAAKKKAAEEAARVAEAKRRAEEAKAAEAKRKAEEEEAARKEAEAKKVIKKVPAKKLTKKEKEAARLKEVEERIAAEARAEIESVGARIKEADPAKLKENFALARNQSDVIHLAKAYLDKNRSSSPQPQMVHGMPESELMHHVEWQGIRWHYVDSEAGISSIANTWKELSLKDMPKRLMAATKDVYFTSLRNKDDIHWEKTYGIKDFKSAATGGYGGICIYNGNYSYHGQIAHEMGHNLADAIYGDTNPAVKVQSAFNRAILSGEKPITTYGQNSNAEDFAEAIRYTLESPERMQERCPQRFQVIRKIFEDESYGG